MRATSALSAALEQGGWDMPQRATPTGAQVRGYFSRGNFADMFGADQADECGGYSLDECAEAVIEWHAEAAR